ncbi:MAG TPA: hypothetical protein VF635_11965, partial [Propionibacteriaceae bacterium]
MRGLRPLLATLLATLALAVPGLAQPSVAQAAEPLALVRITLDSFQPSLPQRSSEITLTGRATNISKKRLVRPRAYFWRNQAPITDREGFDQATESASNEPIGARKIASFDNLYPADDPYLDPGATARFRLEVRVQDLDLSPTPGVYLMGVHVLQNEEVPAIGRARVFVPILAGRPRNTLQMTSIVTLNSRPSLIRAGVLLDGHLAREIAPGGRLDTLLGSADQNKSSFAVDPALIDEISTIEKGYQILGGDGSTADGPGGDDAERWLNRFTQLVATRDGYRLLYGSVDVAAMAHTGQQHVLKASENAAKAVQLTASLPLLVWPGNGAADSPTLAAANTLKPKAVLLSDSSTQASAPLLQGVGGAPLVSYTSTAFAGGPGPDPSDTPVHLQQRMLAESWLQAATEPAGTTLGRVRVISTAAQAAGDDESVKAPWIKPATLTELLSSKPGAWDKELQYTPVNRGRELGPEQVTAINQLSKSWAVWRELLVDPKAARAAADAAVARAASIRRRNAETSFRSFLAPQQDDLDARLNAIKISVTKNVTTPTSQVSFPITILNTLPPSEDPDSATVNAVRVRLDFASSNRQRLTVQPIPLRSIAAGENLPERALVNARTNGTVRVTAQLRTVSGLPVGRPATIDVRATQAGTVGWFIAFGAGVVLLGTTALRIRQVTRERARAAAATADQDEQ